MGKRLLPVFHGLVFCKYRSNGLCRDGSPYKNREFLAVTDMGDLETYDQAKTEAGNADQAVAGDIYHKNPPVSSGLLDKFVNDGNHGIGFRALLCNHREPLSVIHIQDLVPDYHPD